MFQLWIKSKQIKKSTILCFLLFLNIIKYIQTKPIAKMPNEKENLNEIKHAVDLNNVCNNNNNNKVFLFINEKFYFYYFY